jgi:hypothetical protein
MGKLALFSLASAMWAQQITQQDGPFFVRTTAAPVNARIPATLRVVARGSVIVRGSAGDRVTYKLVQRVRTRSREEAEQLFGGLNISVVVPPMSMLSLTVVPTSAPQVSNDLEVSVPKQVLQTLVQTQTGSVEAYDLEGSVQIIAATGVRVDRIHGSVNGHSEGGEIHMGKVDGSVHCSSGGGSVFLDSVGGSVQCGTAGGEIVIRQAGGPVLLSNASGNIEVDRAGSSVEAHTGEGMIEVNQAVGEVIADTHGGSIQVGAARGVHCESAAGTIRVKNISGPLNIQSAMGSILAELIAGARVEDSLLRAASGDVSVTIPAKMPLSVMAVNDSGASPRIQSDFAELRTKTFGFSRPPAVAEGQLNGGGPLLRINVASGIIYLRKLKQ